jgi:hypothetical protein
MYGVVLLIHSWLRWVALVAGFGATLTALPTTPSRGRNDAWGLALVSALDLQLLLGLLLYFVLSPNIAAIRENFGEAMKVPALRFWAVEHVMTMLVAVILVHVGRVLARKAATPQTARKRLLICFGLATILMIAATPWPGAAAGRPLFRWS